MIVLEKGRAVGNTSERLLVVGGGHDTHALLPTDLRHEHGLVRAISRATDPDAMKPPPRLYEPEPTEPEWRSPPNRKQRRRAAALARRVS